MKSKKKKDINITFPEDYQAEDLKGQDVIYHDYESKQEYKYTYYGNYENSYQFTSGKKVILIPNDKGYITYVNTNILSKIFK